jgi:magnesium-protoporphyrin O-methyltransferase
MACCSIPCADTSRFFSQLTRLYRWRFRLFGLEKCQRQMISGIEQVGINNAELLEVGCGIGYLHQALLQAGAARATGIDLSARMLAEAQRQAELSGLTGRTAYRQGDFVELAVSVPMADIVILDKVVCCYPDPERLLKLALAGTRQVIALTYPRDRLFTRAGVALMTVSLRLAGSGFRPYVHKPADIERWINASGFRRHSQALTFEWATDVYVRG